MRDVNFKGAGFTMAAFAMYECGKDGDPIAYAHDHMSAAAVQVLRAQRHARLFGHKGAVTPVDTTDFPLAEQAHTEFVEQVEDQTFFGRVPFQRAPFNVKLTNLTDGGQAAWVDEGTLKPATALAFSPVGRLDTTKLSGFVGMTDAMRSAAAVSVYQIFHRALTNACSGKADATFTDPTNAGGNGVPKSITYDAPKIPSAGDLGAEIAQALGMVAHPERAAILMNAHDAVALAALRSASGERIFPDAGPAGGSIYNAPLYCSAAATPGVIVICDPSQIYVATDGPNIDVANYASIDYGDGQLVDLWTANCFAWRIEWFCNWLAAGPNAVVAITGFASAP